MLVTDEKNAYDGNYKNIYLTKFWKIISHILAHAISIKRVWTETSLKFNWAFRNNNNRPEYRFDYDHTCPEYMYIYDRTGNISFVEWMEYMRKHRVMWGFGDTVDYKHSWIDNSKTVAYFNNIRYYWGVYSSADKVNYGYDSQRQSTDEYIQYGQLPFFFISGRIWRSTYFNV